MPAFVHVVERPDVRIAHSTRFDGDSHPRSPLNHANRRMLSARPWTQLTEDHGVVVREVDGSGVHDGSTGDVLLTRANDAVLEAHIGACCYEFGGEDLSEMERAFGSHVRVNDRAGREALDMGALVSVELTRVVPGVRIIDVGLCTGCRADQFFSHRARVDEQRHVLAVWRQVA